MRQFILRRMLYSLVTLLILSMTIFVVVRLTGDPALLMAEPVPARRIWRVSGRSGGWTAPGRCST